MDREYFLKIALQSIARLSKVDNDEFSIRTYLNFSNEGWIFGIDVYFPSVQDIKMYAFHESHQGNYFDLAVFAVLDFIEKGDVESMGVAERRLNMCKPITEAMAA